MTRRSGSDPPRDGRRNQLGRYRRDGNGKSEEALSWLLPAESKMSGATPYLSTKFNLDVENLKDIPAQIEERLTKLARLKRHRSTCCSYTTGSDRSPAAG